MVNIIVGLCNFALLIFIATRIFLIKGSKTPKNIAMCIGLLLMHLSVLLPLMIEGAKRKSIYMLIIMLDALTIYAFYKMYEGIYFVDDKKESIEKKTENDINTKEDQNKEQQNIKQNESEKEEKITVNTVEKTEVKKKVNKADEKPLYKNRVATDAELREEMRKNAFIEEMKVFLEAHGSSDTDVNKLLEYAIRKTGSGFNVGGVEWMAERDSIKVVYSWAAHSFFDDGGGCEGCITWSITYVESEYNCIYQNEKLNDLSAYRISSTDKFYCKKPFGLNGTYKIVYNGWESSTD